MVHLTAPRRPCPVCLSSERSGYAPVYRLPDFEVVLCKSCGLRFISTEADIKPTFEERQLEEQHVSLEAVYQKKVQKDFAQLQAIWRAVARSRHENARLLDVGCGTGLFLQEARRHGWQACGVEVNQSAAKYAGERGNHHIVIHDAEIALPFRAEFFDIVTMFGVIEHLENPVKTLAECTRVLRRDGIMVIQTPTEDALLRRAARCLYRFSGGRFTFPAYQLYSLHGGHNLCFSRRSLRTLLERLGFSVRRCVNSTYGLRILLHRFDKQPWPARWVKQTGTAVLFSFGKALGLSNHVTAFAIKV